MIILKSLIHDVASNWVEATWVDRIQLPDVEVPESFGPTTRAEDGSIIPGELIPAHTAKGGLQDTQVKCHSYADVQMDMLRADAKELGTPLDEHEALITIVESGIKPHIPEPINRISIIQAELNVLDMKKIRPMATGDTTYLALLNAQSDVLRSELKGLLK